jgi:hypothetical protein
MVQDFNQDMAGIDWKDGQLHMHKLLEDCLKKYYQKIFRYMLDLAYLNIFIVYKNDGMWERLDLLMSFGESLAVSYNSHVCTEVNLQRNQSPEDSLDANTLT